MAGSTSRTGRSTDYEFVTVWRVAGTREEVVDVLGDASTLKQWWPAVYLEVTPVTTGNPDGTGNAFDLHTKGWLPYTLRWRLTVTEPVTLHGFALTAKGDLNGTGRWTFETDGPEVVITYDWRVSTAKPLLRRLSWLLKPPSPPTITGPWPAVRKAWHLSSAVVVQPPIRHAFQHRLAPPSRANAKSCMVLSRKEAIRDRQCNELPIESKPQTRH